MALAAPRRTVSPHADFTIKIADTSRSADGIEFQAILAGSAGDEGLVVQLAALPRKAANFAAAVKSKD